MGPRPFSRGNLVYGLIGLIGLSRIGIEVVGLLQWGHDLSAVETLAMPYTIVISLSGFNGATTFQPWKQPT